MKLSDKISFLVRLMCDAEINTKECKYAKMSVKKQDIFHPFTRLILKDIPDIDIMVRVFSNGLGDLGLIPSQVIPKTQKMVLDAILLNTQHYKVRIKGEVKWSRERSSALNLPLGVVAIEKGALGSPSTTVTNFTYLLSESSAWKVPCERHICLTNQLIVLFESRDFPES